MATHIIFDLGDVLIHIHPELAIRSFSEACGLEQEKIKTFLLSDLHLRFMRGDCSTREFYKAMSEEYSCDLDERKFQKIWNQVIGSPKDGIKEIIEELKLSYSLILCSNTDPWHWQKVWHEVPFIKLFSHIFLSFEMNLNKPDASVFKLILSELGVEGQNCIFIDDTPENINSAEEFGIHGIAASEPRIIRQELQRLKILG
jgi:putative hydrolase of the HAD superfamily